MQKNNKVLKMRLLLMAVLVCSLLSAQNIEQVYKDVPSMISPVLSAKQRMEMLEYAKANLSDSIKNPFGNWSRVIELDTLQKYICVQHAADTEFQMMLFTTSGAPDSVYTIGIIETVCAPICSSTVHFYNPQWNENDASIPHKFQTANFLDMDLCRTDSVDMDIVQELLTPIFVRAHFNKAERTLVLTNETLNMQSEADQQKYARYLRPLVVSVP